MAETSGRRNDCNNLLMPQHFAFRQFSEINFIMTSAEKSTPALPETGTRDKFVEWYTPTLENISSAQKDAGELQPHRARSGDPAHPRGGTMTLPDQDPPWFFESELTNNPKQQFLHLFELEGEVRACEGIASLMKPGKGGLILGQQVVSLEPRPIAEASGMYW